MKTDSLKVAIESKLVIKTNELIAENIILKERLRWRHDECPQYDGDYLVKVILHEGTDCEHVEYVVKKYSNTWGWGGSLTYRRIIAWMPIPSESY